MFLESDYSNSITPNQILLLRPCWESSVPNSPHADVVLHRAVKEKYSWPLVSKARIDEWPSIMTLQQRSYTHSVCTDSAFKRKKMSGLLDWWTEFKSLHSWTCNTQGCMAVVKIAIKRESWVSKQFKFFFFPRIQYNAHWDSTVMDPQWVGLFNLKTKQNRNQYAT